ncbi:hypothetical protein NP493_818g02007 [Ridgeia piscesae]|uniref:Chitin-binding type-2 domain-containing protein n=1 Tax=Ridgeia piscesae TaxID=27915 RepID=A0AAD9KN59_RIDPI|nr:hypothetical protein NP493_818g02007 [Ridgeia piscesae]
MCDLKRYRSRVCESEPCVGDYVESEDCACVPLNAAVDCSMVAGADSVYGLLGDPCNCQNYYQCEYNTTTEQFIAIQRSCNPCEIWDQEVLTCVRDESKGDCTFFPTTQGIGECPLGEADNPAQFILGNETMDCAPGTTFNLTLCTCIRIVPYVTEMVEIASVMFEDEKTITASKGLWLFNQNVELTSDGCMSGKCGFFNSTAESKLELAYFSNALDRFEQFSVRLFFKRSAGVSGERSLVDNSDCTIDGSVVGKSSASDALGYFANENGTKVDFSVPAAEDTWYQLVMAFDGEFASVYLNKDLVSQEALGGRLNRVKASMVFGGCTCGGDCYFDGYLDSVCSLGDSALVVVYVH